MRGYRKLIVAVLLIALTAQGCDFGRRFMRKPWGWGTVVPALVCGGIGAASGIVIQNNRPGHSAINSCDATSHQCQSLVVGDDKNLWQGGLIGGAIGVVLCGLAGHAIFDPEPTPEPPPPPPPLPTPTPVPMKRKIVLRGVNFDFDKSDIRMDSRPVLDEAVATLREYPTIRVLVEGHTDAIGTDEYNQKLSERRANAVYRYLVSAGVTPDRMEVAGLGESRPVAENETEGGRAQNRRVELRVLDTGP